MILSLAVQDPPTAPQTPPPVDPEEISIEGIVVDGRPLDEAVRDYVGAVAGPARGRGLAQWRSELCLGVANLPAQYAQAMIDRVADIATELKIPIGEPGCEANALVIFTEDGAGLARALIEEDRRTFRVGASGLDLGSSALERFRDTTAPVRWWQVSVPVDSETGQVAVRLPGASDSNGEPSVPQINVFAASRLVSQIRDDLNRTIVIVDVDDISAVSFEQLSDYVAMVTLAQVDPEGSTAGFTSILGVFEDPTVTASLSDWDWAYLRALYSTRSMRRNPAAMTGDVAGFMARDRRAAQDAN
ncbi:MAG: hypothetical protein ACK4FG_03975 [Brevundimonas sp.]